MSKCLLLVALAVMVVLSGCASKDCVFDRVEFVPQEDGTICAEVWVEAPDLEGGRIVGDTKQDVVSLIHSRGKMALPDRVAYTGDREQISETALDQSGYVPVAVYHLIAMDDDREIDYYKRKFARKGNQ